MTTSCDLEISITSGFLHGYEFTDRRQMEFIKNFLEINARFIGHPMVLVGLFTELQYQHHQSIHEIYMTSIWRKAPMQRIIYHQSTFPFRGWRAHQNHTGRIGHHRKDKLASTGPLKLSTTSRDHEEGGRGHWQFSAGHRRQKLWSKTQNPPRGHVL